MREQDRARAADSETQTEEGAATGSASTANRQPVGAEDREPAGTADGESGGAPVGDPGGAPVGDPGSTPVGELGSTTPLASGAAAAGESAGTAVVDSQAQPAPAPAPSLDQLVSSAIESIPDLALQANAVRTVFVCYMTYVGSDEIQVLATDARTALTELSLTRGWSADDIDKACTAVIDGLADAWTGLAADFAATAAGLAEGDPAKLDFELVARRFAAEQQEQDGLRGRARELLGLVKTVSGQLGVPNPDVTATAAAGAGPSESESSGRLADRLRRLASPIVDFVTEDADKPDGAPADSGSAAAAGLGPGAPSWTTPPALADDDPDVRTLEQVLARRAASAADVRLIWSGLAALGLGQTEVAALLGRVAVQARRQLAQSDQVMQNVTTSHRQFTGRIEAIQRMMAVTHAVYDYFFPGPR